jgi:transcriptional regulator with XRE-family HTH domain
MPQIKGVPHYWKSKSTGSTPLGDRLKQERLRRQFPLHVFCDKVGMSDCSLTAIENRGAMSSVKNLIAICQVLECSTDWLLGLEE